MAAREANKLLFEILDECALQPVLQTGEADVDTNKSYKLSAVQDAVQKKREVLHRCSSNEEVYRVYHEYIESEEAAGVQRELRDLKLPSLADCRAQFEQAAATLFDTGVRKHSRLP